MSLMKYLIKVMKSYTDLEQSKKLATILPIDSADMWWDWFGNPLDDVNDGEYSTEPLLHKPVSNPRNIIPCWSLAALLDILPLLERKGYQKTKPQLFYIVHINKWIVDSHVYTTDAYDNPIDACVEMILKLKEKDLL